MGRSVCRLPSTSTFGDHRRGWKACEQDRSSRLSSEVSVSACLHFEEFPLGAACWMLVLMIKVCIWGSVPTHELLQFVVTLPRVLSA